MDGRERCANCGASRSGEYCSACGERRLRPEDRRLGALAREAAAAVLDTDGRLLRSLRALAFAPGLLTADWLRGRRRHWFGPVGLYLLVNVAVFLAPPLGDLDLSLREQIELQPWSESARALVEERLAQRDETLGDYARSYEATSPDVGKALLVWHLPFVALALMLVCGPRRTWFVGYLVLALHEFTLLLVALLLAGWVLGPLIALLLAPTGFGDRVFPVLLWSLLIAFCLHGAHAARRVLDPGWLRLACLVPALVLALGLGHASYRLLQFLVTFALT